MSVEWTQHGYAALGLKASKTRDGYRIPPSCFLVARVRRPRRHAPFSWRVVFVRLIDPKGQQGAYVSLHGVMARSECVADYPTRASAEDGCIAYVMGLFMRGEYGLTDESGSQAHQRLVEYLRGRRVL